MSTATFPSSLPPAGAPRLNDPKWELVELFPTQGNWSEEDYLALDTNRLVELRDGFLEVLPMPTPYHQDIVEYVHRHLHKHVVGRDLGRAYFAPLPVRAGLSEVSGAGCGVSEEGTTERSAPAA